MYDVVKFKSFYSTLFMVGRTEVGMDGSLPLDLRGEEGPQGNLVGRQPIDTEKTRSFQYQEIAGLTGIPIEEVDKAVYTRGAVEGREALFFPLVEIDNKQIIIAAVQAGTDQIHIYLFNPKEDLTSGDLTFKMVQDGGGTIHLAEQEEAVKIATSRATESELKSLREFGVPNPSPQTTKEFFEDGKAPPFLILEDGENRRVVRTDGFPVTDPRKAGFVLGFISLTQPYNLERLGD